MASQEEFSVTELHGIYVPLLLYSKIEHLFHKDFQRKLALYISQKLILVYLSHETTP